MYIKNHDEFISKVYAGNLTLVFLLMYSLVFIALLGKIMQFSLTQNYTYVGIIVLLFVIIFQIIVVKQKKWLDNKYELNIKPFFLLIYLIIPLMFLFYIVKNW